MLSLQNLNLKLSSADLIPSPNYSQNIGLGTRGLGSQCNQAIARDREQCIKHYIEERDKLGKSRSPEPQQQRKGRGTSGSRTDYKAIKQKIEQAKELVRIETVKQRKANEEAIEAARRADAERKKADVEREKMDTRARREKQIEAKRQWIKAWKERVREEIQRDQEIARQEEQAELTRVATRHEQQKQFRQMCKERAEQERQAREAFEKQMVEQQRRKLQELNQERIKLQQDILHSKRTEVVSFRSEQTKRVARMKEQAEKDIELARELNVAEKERFLQELALKRKQMAEHKKELFDSRKSGSRSPSPSRGGQRGSSRVSSPAGSPAAGRFAMTSRSVISSPSG